MLTLGMLLVTSPVQMSMCQVKLVYYIFSFKQQKVLYKMLKIMHIDEQMSFQSVSQVKLK